MRIAKGSSTAAIERGSGIEMPVLRERLGRMQAGRASQGYTPGQPLIKAAGNKTGLSQQAFADLIKTPGATPRDWEHGRSPPPGPAV